MAKPKPEPIKPLPPPKVNENREEPPPGTGPK